MWGKQSDLEDINFEWPSQFLIDRNPEIKLKSLELGSKHAALSYVRVNLSHEISSPAFMNEDHSHPKSATIRFDQDVVPVRKISASDKKGAEECLRELRFKDYAGNQIGLFNPADHNLEQTEFEIGDG